MGGLDEIATRCGQRSLFNKDEEWDKVKEFELITEQIIEEDEEFNQRWPAPPSVLVFPIAVGQDEVRTLERQDILDWEG